MRARLSSILTLITACLLSHTPAHAEIFRCDGVDGSTMFTNIACPPGTRPVTVVTSTDACNGECEREHRETSESSPARKDVKTEKRRRVKDEAAPMDWPEPEEPVYAPAETAGPETSTPADPLINAAPVYPVGVPPTIIVLPPSHHRPHPHRPDHGDGGQHGPDQHHAGHHDHDHHHGGGEMDSANHGAPKPMRDPNGSHSHSGVRGGSQGQQAADDKDGNRPIGPRQQKDKDMRRNPS